MSDTVREYKGEEYPDKSRKKIKDKKQFVHRGDGWSTKSQGGSGNKMGWGGFFGAHNWRNLPKWLYRKYKEKQLYFNFYLIK